MDTPPPPPPPRLSIVAEMDFVPKKNSASLAKRCTGDNLCFSERANLKPEPDEALCEI